MRDTDFDLPDESEPDSTRRSLLQGIGVTASIATLGTMSTGAVTAAESTASASDQRTYTLPPLPYDYDALEPHIDAQIMRLHHDKHHQGYVKGANTALRQLAQMRQTGDFDDIKHIKRDLSFNLSGHILHSIFWQVMSPDGGGNPEGNFASALEQDFGSVSAFKKEFSKAAANVEDSGWGMLVYDHLADRLLVIQAEDHNDLAVQGATPLLVLDVWEHAYYLQYQTKREKYINAFWNVVDWDAIADRYAALTQCNLLDSCST